jgi:hypothetical protein
LTSYTGQAQSLTSEQEQFYKNALDKILTSPELVNVFPDQIEGKQSGFYAVYDSSVSISYTHFFDNFQTNNMDTQKSLKLIDSLSSIEEYNNRQNSIDLSWIPDNPKSDLVIYFTRPYKNSFVAEIFLFDPKQSSHDYKNAPMFGESVAFLFLFDEDGSIKNYYSTTVINN